eukprot:668744-Prymnesium_polylepis.1
MFKWSSDASYPFPLAHYYFWVEFSLLCTTGLYWLYRLNQSLGLYPPLFIIPLMQSSYIIFGVVGSGIYYEVRRRRRGRPAPPHRCGRATTSRRTRGSRVAAAERGASRAYNLSPLLLRRRRPPRAQPLSAAV